MPRRTLIDFFADRRSDRRRVPRLRRRLSHVVVSATARSPRRRARSRRGCAPRVSASGQHGRDLEREPAGVDRRALGLPARRRRPRPDRLPRLGRLPRRASPTSSTPARSCVGDVVDRGRDRSATRPIWRARGSARRGRADGRRRRRRPPSITAGRHRRDHLHVRRDRRTEGRRHHPPQHPREHRPDRARDGEVPQYARPFLPIRFLNLLPLSHMFGQAMATFVPPMLPGVVVFTRSYAPRRHRPADPRRGGSRCWCACRRSSRC